MSTSLRTVWLTLRATNYTTAVFTNVISNLSGFDRATQKAINSSLNLGKSALAVGMITGVLGNQIGGAGGQLLTYTSYMMYAVAAMSYAKAAIIVLNSMIYAQGIVVGNTAIMWSELAASILGAVGAFMLVYVITNQFGKIAGLVVGLALAILGLAMSITLLKAIISGGGSLPTDIASYAGVGVMAGGIAGMVYAGTHQMGTRMAGATGPAFLHKGEVVYNPATGRPTQIGNDLQGGVGGVTSIDASTHIETVNTKMDTEEMNELLKKQGRKIANDRR